MGHLSTEYSNLSLLEHCIYGVLVYLYMQYKYHLHTFIIPAINLPYLYMRYVQFCKPTVLVRYEYKSSTNIRYKYSRSRVPVQKVRKSTAYWE